MDFTIVTPSLRQLDWLECCIASIADQGLWEGKKVRKNEDADPVKGVTVEHIVQDAGTEGFKEFAKKMQERWPDREGYRRVMISEPDGGMYDAINKGLKRGAGRICAYLNCDEQYLPGALAKVKEEFARHPTNEILYGGFLVVNEKGELVTAQKPVRMFWPHVATSHLPNFTCATFFLRSMLERDQAWFDSSYRACGDAAWTVERLKDQIPIQVSRAFTSVFVEGESNQGIEAPGLREAAHLREGMPLWVKAGFPLWRVGHRLQKVFCGHYLGQRVEYGLYLPAVCAERKNFLVKRAKTIWGKRLRL